MTNNLIFILLKFAHRGKFGGFMLSKFAAPNSQQNAENCNKHDQLDILPVRFKIKHAQVKRNRNGS